jgi:hypothetical protein
MGSCGLIERIRFVFLAVEFEPVTVYDETGGQMRVLLILRRKIVFGH